MCAFCSEQGTNLPESKLSKVMLYLILCAAVLYNIDNSTVESMAPIFRACRFSGVLLS